MLSSWTAPRHWKADSIGKAGSSDVTSTVAICSRSIQCESGCGPALIRSELTILFRTLPFSQVGVDRALTAAALLAVYREGQQNVPRFSAKIGRSRNWSAPFRWRWSGPDASTDPPFAFTLLTVSKLVGRIEVPQDRAVAGRIRAEVPVQCARENCSGDHRNGRGLSRNASLWNRAR